MKPYFEAKGMTLYHGDALDVLRGMESESVQCCVTSPPYWGLRSYLETDHPDKPLEIGLEATLPQYLEKMTAIFREVRRVLRADGVLWLNLGDSYATGAGRVGSSPGGGKQGEEWTGFRGDHPHDPKRKPEAIPRGPMTQPNRMPQDSLKPKDLCGVPWRIAFALQADGWYLRSDVIWHKPNPLPESVTDRPTKSHEYLFMLAKSPRYYFDQVAIRERHGISAIVEAPDLVGHGLVGGKDFRLEKTPCEKADIIVTPTHLDGRLGALCIQFASTIFELAQPNDDVCLSSLDAEVWEQGLDNDDGLAVVGVPVIRIATALATRLSDGDISAKQFSKEIDRLCVALPDGNKLKEAWRLAVASAPMPVVNTDADRPIRVNHSGKISQVELVHDDTSNEQYTTQHTSSSTAGRNRRSVWTIPTQAFPSAHFATYPEALVRPCIQAGTSEYGCCNATVKKLRLRQDLSEEDRAKVYARLGARGIA